MKRILSIKMGAEEAREVLQGKRDSLCILIKPQPSRDAVWVNSGYMKDGSEFIFPTYKPEDTAYIREPWLHTEEGYRNQYRKYSFLEKIKIFQIGKISVDAFPKWIYNKSKEFTNFGNYSGGKL